MASENIPLIAFNRGVISPLALCRVDLKRTAMSAETQTNFMPRLLGSMMLRPGMQYIVGTKSNLAAIHIPFIFSTTDTAILQFTNTVMRILISGTALTRVSVSTAVTNGTFGAAGSWTDNDESGATSTIASNTLTLTGTRYSRAIRDQVVTVAGGDQNKEHALRVIVTKGLVTFSVGSTNGDDDYVTRTVLGVGIHSLAFTPTGNFYIRFANSTQNSAKVTNCTVEASGTVEITTPWLTADLGNMRWDQSADVIYVACSGYQQRKIERRGTGRSWSIVLYQPADGPFRVMNLTTTSITPSAQTGDVTLTANRSLFKSTQVGALYTIDSTGQNVTFSVTGDDQWTDPIRVTGVTNSRIFTIVRSGTWVASPTLQRSSDGGTTWENVTQYTTNGTVNYDDGLDNQILLYRIGVNPGDYTSGTVVLTLTYYSGSITGVVRITAFTSATSVTAEVLTALGNTGSSVNWSEGEWSDRRGWPSAVALHQGRLWWGGTGKIWGSVSDAYESYDPTVEGDSGPINRSIGSGPLDRFNWMIRIKRLLIGTGGAEWMTASSSLDEPLTPSNFNMDDPTNQGSANVPAVKVDDRAIFVQRSAQKVYQTKNSGDAFGTYETSDLMELCPELGRPALTRLAVQRQPDTRVHSVRSDGKVAVLISQPAENLLCWVLVETDGVVEDVFTMPGTEEDEVYYLVKRTVNGGTVRYLEKWALESDCIGSTLNKQADSFLSWTGASSTTITGLSHLEACSVVVWANGKDLGTYTVASGQITISEAATSAIIGLTYTAKFKSAKLAFAAQQGTALTMAKRLIELGLVLANTHYQGLKYGPDFSTLDSLPLIEDGKETAANTVWSSLDTGPVSLNGAWDTDSRMCLQAQAPRPCTVLGAVLMMKTNG